jgi:hypothetical protein
VTRPLRDVVEASRERVKRARMRAYLRWCSSGERCSACAYRPGTEASGDEVDVGLTRLRRALLDAAQPFYCHEPGPVAAMARKRLCVGHMNAMTSRHLSGYYAAHPPDAPEVLAELGEAWRVRQALYIAAEGSE